MLVIEESCARVRRKMKRQLMTLFALNIWLAPQRCASDDPSRKAGTQDDNTGEAGRQKPTPQ